MSLFIPTIARATDENGDTMSGALLYFYETGGLVPATVYSDPELTTAHANPVVADSAGMFPVIFYDSSESLRVILKKSTGETIVDVDPYNSSTASTASIDVTDHGATGNGTTDDYAAIMAAIAALPDTGGAIEFPPGRYRVAQRIVVTKPVHFLGSGLARNSGIVGSTTYAYPNFINGTSLYFDSGVAGIYFQTHTAETNRATVAALPEDGTKYTQQGAQYSSIRDMAILSAGGGTTGVNGTHGVKTHTQISMSNVMVRGFGGDGVHLNGTIGTTTHYAESQYGNVSHCVLYDVFCNDNGGNGLFIDGRDANACPFYSVNCASNGLWGINDQSLLGNGYYGCHLNGNESGAVRVIGESAASEFWSCYIETAATGTSGVANLCSLGQSVIVMGGIMADRNNHSAQPTYYIQSGRASYGRGLAHINDDGSKEVAFTMGERGTNMTAFTFGSEDDPGNTGSVPNGFGLRFGYQTSNWWGLGYGGSSANVFIEFPNQLGYPRAMAPSFRNGLMLGGGGAGPRIHYDSAAPTSGNWQLGDWILNSAVTAGGSPGWVCTTTGTAGALAATTGSITNGSTNLNLSGNNLVYGNYITIAGVTGVKKVLSTATISTTGSITSGSADLTVASTGSGVNVMAVGQGLTIAGVTGLKRITAINDLVVTLDSTADATVSGAAVTGHNAVIDSAADATVSGAAVAYKAPVFKTMAAVAA